jgi:ribonuclease P protein component
MSKTYKLPRTLKLNRKIDIDFVFEQPSIKISNAFFLILARQNQLAIPRLGLVIAKKNLKKAVDRNKVKRVSREFFRLHQQWLQGYDWIVLTRPQVKTLLKKKAVAKNKECGMDPINVTSININTINKELRNTWNKALQKIPKP